MDPCCIYSLYKAELSVADESTLAILVRDTYPAGFETVLVVVFKLADWDIDEALETSIWVSP